MSDHPLPLHVVKINKQKSLLAIVQNAIKGGDNFMFRNLYAIEDEKEIDILENGSNSCAAFVSWILLSLELIKRPHATVFATQKDLLNSGWQETPELKVGAVLVWESITGEMLNEKVQHLHVGFYVGNDEAVSNSSKTGFPEKHHVTYNGTRDVQKILWHPDLV